MQIRLDRIKLITEMAKRDIGVCDLAEKAGTSRATISYIRNGKSCSPKIALSIASALDMTLEELKEG